MPTSTRRPSSPGSAPTSTSGPHADRPPADIVAAVKLAESRRRPGADDRRRDRLPPRGAGRRRRARRAAELRAGPLDARRDPRHPPPLRRRARPRPPILAGRPTMPPRSAPSATRAGAGRPRRRPRPPTRRLALVADGSAARVRAARLAFVQGTRPRRSRATRRPSPPPSTRGSRATRSPSTTRPSATCCSPPATPAAPGPRSRPRSPRGPTTRRRWSASPGSTPSTATPRRRHRRARRGDRRDPAARLARAPRRPARAMRGRARRRRAGRGRPATIDAIAQLAGEAGCVYDRGLSLYLSDHGLEPDRAVRLARDELATRTTSTATTPWPGRCSTPATRPAPLRRCASALAAGTQDARLWYHAGLIAAANGRSARGRRPPRTRALALGPALDPVARDRAADALATLRDAAVARHARAACSSPRCSSRSSRRRSRSPTRWATSRSTTTRASGSSRRGSSSTSSSTRPRSRPSRRSQASTRTATARSPPAELGRAASGRAASRWAGRCPHGRRRARAADAWSRPGPRLPAGQRRPVDAAARVHVRGRARDADRRRDHGLVPRRLRGVPHRLARDRPSSAAGSPSTRPASPRPARAPA